MIRIVLVCLVTIFLNACAQRERTNTKYNKNQTNLYLFKDPSGEYILKREVLQSLKQIKLRQALYLPSDMENALEKSVTVSEYGTLTKSGKTTLAIRPVASQFSIWFDKQKYFSQIKLNKEKKNFELYLDSPDNKWKGKSEKEFIRGSKYCWFSQLPECLKRIINNTKNSKLASSFVIVWDSFPYYNEQYQKLSGKLFTPASLRFDGKFGQLYRFAVDVEGQVIFYHYDKNLIFEKMTWISQGISLEKNN